MDLDNPSYFAVPTDEPDCSAAQIRQKKRSENSETVLNRQLTPPKYNGNRREIRALLRSVSSNSADSNHELLIMGEPRLSDMAPSLAYKHPSRSNSLKKAQENPRCIPMSEEDEGSDGLLEEDEVFLADDGARYSNCSAVKRVNGSSSLKRSGSPRRHSISSFNARDRASSVASSSRSFKGDFSATMQESVSATSKVDEHSLRHMAYPRKTCLMCTRGNFSKPPANMDDILIVSLKSSEPANLWVDYFASYFEQISKQANRKAPFKIRNAYLEDSLTPKIEDQKFIEGATGVKLQLVVVCPGFLDFVAQHPEESAGLAKLLLADRTLALLLGVTDDDVTEAHRNALPLYFQWQRQSVGQDQDQTFTKKFLNQAMTILSKIWKQQSSVTAQEKSGFSVTPKKIKQGQNSVSIILTHPLQKDDLVKISLERNGELHEIKSVKRRNPYVVKITVPENLIDITAIVNILVEKNGNIIGSRPVKCESKFRELEQILRSANNPVEFMCQTLGFSPADREHLDSWLVHGFQKNLPPHFNLFGTHNTPFSASITVRKQSNEEFPTLLHFAAKFGLEKLAAQLMDCPGAEIAYEVRNVFGMTPIEIADSSGHNSLSSTLKNYKSMHEVTSCYTTLKHFSLRSKSEEDEEGYLKPREIDNLYKLCPAPRPVNPEMMRSCPTPIVTPSSECGSSLYLAMDRTAIAFSREDLRKSENEPTSPKKELDRQNHRSPSPNARKRKANAIVEDKFQRELAEIITDFKNNVHSLAQVEKLVEEWKNRNDVQKSFKEKQDQLNQMRLSYEKMQQEYKAKTKKSSPVDKFMKLFSRQSKTDEQSEEITSENVISGPALALNQSARPISSLSTSSSGSSGRMSTISGCSVGDSGTHSDNEDRKLMISNSQGDNDFKELDFSKTNLELNYTPVPVPKPVKFSSMHHFETIEENKPVSRPDTLSISEQFYIQFPPNGQPVSGFDDAQSETPKNNYMNLPGPPSSHEYINYNPAT
ncbi:phosphoinositide 3-kinase adapter protein 1 isoform X2 [Dendroctonus ponderosae]|uniref:phosphoinositide 3-kinase adapter protein 1 isoform X2 n=1 Tax=Dendroctonus ponderosae TaxID=77166 RepID=UPI002034BEE2|nr:phosphoinositide 3-kinase adapter protein 1 isoform X2 [Dendroctonus ponderosae]